jgi:hypothetical protein
MPRHLLAGRLALPASFAFLIAPLAAEDPAAAPPGAGLAAALQPFVDRHELAGAVVLAATKEKVLALEAVGFAACAAPCRRKTSFPPRRTSPASTG